LVMMEPKRCNEKGRLRMGGPPVTLAMHGTRSSARLMSAHSTHAARPDVAAVVFLADRAHVLGVATFALAAAGAAAAVTGAGQSVAIAAG
jgi:hypothetical protein